MPSRCPRPFRGEPYANSKMPANKADEFEIKRLLVEPPSGLVNSMAMSPSWLVLRVSSHIRISEGMSWVICDLCLVILSSPGRLKSRGVMISSDLVLLQATVLCFPTKSTLCTLGLIEDLLFLDRMHVFVPGSRSSLLLYFFQSHFLN